MDNEAAGGSGAKRARGVSEQQSGGATEQAPAWGQPPPPHQGPSRIYRVKASGGKDRHSKVYTAKGIRDRRVRLSVPTAIQFYDLQDRLGFDQPSKAVEWLINAAAAAIDRLPSLDPAAFADMPDQADAGKAKLQQQASSTSETSKGSELSLSRSDARAGGAAGSGDREVTVASNPAQAASFTELLTGSGAAPAAAIVAADHRQPWQSPVSADGVADARPGKGAQRPSTYAFSGFGNAPPIGMAPAQPFNFTNSAAQMAHLPYAQDALVPSPAQTGHYSLDFSMSSGFLGANRGTLQSNSPSHFSAHHHQLQRLDDGPSPPFLYEHAAAAAHPASENHLTATASLQLWNGFRHSGLKEEKTKN